MPQRGSVERLWRLIRCQEDELQSYRSYMCQRLRSPDLAKVLPVLNKIDALSFTTLSRSLEPFAWLGADEVIHTSCMKGLSGLSSLTREIERRINLSKDNEPETEHFA